MYYWIVRSMSQRMEMKHMILTEMVRYVRLIMWLKELEGNGWC